jgi:flagellar protein FliO/FliZ
MDTLFVALRVLLSLAAVVGLLWFLQRRMGNKSIRATKLVNVVTRQPLAQKASVVVIDVEGKRFLLGVTEHSVTVLDANELPVLDTAAAFESAMSDAEAMPKPRRSIATPIPFPQQFDPRTGLPRRAGVLDGSILSLSTWKRAAVALRSSR